MIVILLSQSLSLFIGNEIRKKILCGGTANQKHARREVVGDDVGVCWG